MSKSAKMGHSIETTLNYHLDKADGSDRDYYPGTLRAYRRKYDVRPVSIQDIRSAEEMMNLNDHGFQFYNHDSAEEDFVDQATIKDVVYNETEQLLKDVTGATTVHVFSHILRRGSFEEALAKAATSEPDETGIGFVPPTRYIHVDQSDAGAHVMLAESLPPDEVKRLSQTRWAIINVWRPLKPVPKDPLAVCDARSIPDNDLVEVRAYLPPKGSGTFENVAKGAEFQVLEARYGEGHRWYFVSDMTPKEVLLIKCFDSRRDGKTARRAPHSAFIDPNTEHVEVVRESIELRCLVFYENEPIE